MYKRLVDTATDNPLNPLLSNLVTTYKKTVNFDIPNS